MDKTASIKLLIVIVNYRTAALTIDCLRSLETEVGLLGDAVRVIVTDNASGDDSSRRIGEVIEKNDWGVWATLRPLPKKMAGSRTETTQGLRDALESESPPDYVVLLNPDTIVRDGAMWALVSFMEAHRDVGLAGSRLEDPDGTAQRSAFRFPSVLSELEDGMRLGVVSRLLSGWIVAPAVPENSCQVDWVAGASLIVRRAVFDDVGLLDERYFMYFEEVDFCLHANA